MKNNDFKIENYEQFKDLLFNSSRKRIISDHRIYIVNMIKNNKNRKFTMNYLSKIINKNHSAISYYLKLFNENKYLKEDIINNCKNNIDVNHVNLFVNEVNKTYFEDKINRLIEIRKKRKTIKIISEYEYFIDKKILVYFDNKINKFISIIVDEKNKHAVSNSPISAINILVNKYKKSVQ